MTAAALVLFAVYLVIGFGLRTWLQWRRTGDSGFRGISGRLGTAPWWAGVLFVLALVAGGAGPVTALFGGLEPLQSLSAGWLQAAGAGIAVAGVIATFLAQLDMGTNWRIGVDHGEVTELVTTGVFGWVRNPIFSAMAGTGAGLALMVPNVVAVGGLLLLLLALQLQVRVVEEPYLRALHGAAYASYAASTGRFLPGIGRDRINAVPATRLAGGDVSTREAGAW